MKYDKVRHYRNCAMGILDGKLKANDFVFCPQTDLADIQKLSGGEKPFFVNPDDLMIALEKFFMKHKDVSMAKNLVEFFKSPWVGFFAYQTLFNVREKLRKLAKESKTNEERVPLRNAEVCIYKAILDLNVPFPPVYVDGIAKEPKFVLERMHLLIPGCDYADFLRKLNYSANAVKLAYQLIEHGFVEELSAILDYIQNIDGRLLNEEWKGALKKAVLRSISTDNQKLFFDEYQQLTEILSKFDDEFFVDIQLILLKAEAVLDAHCSVFDGVPLMSMYTDNHCVLYNLLQVVSRSANKDIYRKVFVALADFEVSCGDYSAQALAVEVTSKPVSVIDDYLKMLSFVRNCFNRSAPYSRLLRICMNNVITQDEKFANHPEVISFRHWAVNAIQLWSGVNGIRLEDTLEFLWFYGEISSKENDWMCTLPVIIDSHIDAKTKYDFILKIAKCHANQVPIFLSDEQIQKLEAIKAELPEEWCSIF